MNKKSDTIESEYSVIGGLLRENSKLQEIEIGSDDFNDDNLALIFDAIESLINNGTAADAITVAEYLHERTQINYLPLISQTILNTPSAYNIKAYADIIKKVSTRRKAEAIAVRLQDEIWTNENIIDEVMSELLALNSGKKSFECSLDHAVNVALEFLDEQHRHKGKITGISTGLFDLDSMLGGFHETDLIAIGGRPAMGKTSFMLNCCEKCDVPAGIITGEQGRNQIAQRMLMINGQINSYRMRLSKLSEDDWKNIIDSAARLRKMKSWLYDKPAPTIMDVARQARRWKFHHNIKILFIDYIQRMKGDYKLKRHEQIEEIVRLLKEIARELNIPVVALAQINREVERRPNKRPFMSDFKDSGAIEQESDIMMTLYRDEVYIENSPDKGTAEINIVKNRHGPLGMVPTLWIGQYMKFDDYREDDIGD